MRETVIIQSSKGFFFCIIRRAGSEKNIIAMIKKGQKGGKNGKRPNIK